ncbi:hypothetical protein, variant [Exophiala mesophila]|uniref:Peptidase C14 caspase domain-containing protein n=1 Tax=Exophiala mesophila TaxID=212818 RepID=A0A0D1ZMG5_EXOME|nr:hypothetical protein, variant [Exophiala mesophila]KIV95159.1 hypothetical protein, variant [Exophiala mesophila]
MSNRRKCLLIGINYLGSKHQLQGCIDDVMNMTEFLASRNYPRHPLSMVTMTDSPQTAPTSPYYPSGHNILAAMDWLVSEPGCMLFLHYSGHGGQVPGQRETGFDDTIVPVDFESMGMIDSGTLHRHLVSALAPACTLVILFDCCHSGSAVELPFVYRTDEEGNLNLLDNLRMGANLIREVSFPGYIGLFVPFRLTTISQFHFSISASEIASWCSFSSMTNHLFLQSLPIIGQPSHTWRNSRSTR